MGEALDGDLLLVGLAPEDDDPDLAIERYFLDDRGHVEVGATPHNNIVNLGDKLITSLIKWKKSLSTSLYFFSLSLFLSLSLYLSLSVSLSPSLPLYFSLSVSFTLSLSLFLSVSLSLFVSLYLYLFLFLSPSPSSLSLSLLAFSLSGYLSIFLY